MRALILLIAGIILLACNAVSGEKKVVCYFNSWAVYRTGNGFMGPGDIAASLCTHAIYNVADITDDAYIQVHDWQADLPSGRNGYYYFNQLRNVNRKLKTLIAVGGVSEGSARFSRIASNAQLRQKFVDNALDYVRSYGFDGLDLQWSYPTDADRQNFVLLLKQLKERFARNNLILSALLLGSQESTASYDIPETVKYLDFANIITYDLHGLWDRKTGINSPLYPASWEYHRKINVDAIVTNWLSQGAPSEKLIIAIPTYGRTFTLDSAQNKGVNAPASQPGLAGPYTRTAGFLGYNEICESTSKSTWENYYEYEQQIPYMVQGNQWVGYDNVQSANEKVKYIRDHNLGGAMVYTVDTDDVYGFCVDSVNPLLRAANNVLYM